MAAISNDLSSPIEGFLNLLTLDDFGVWGES